MGKNKFGVSADIFCMRIVVAECSVDYSGRGETYLPSAVRAIIIKEDGSVAIHNDKSNKPINYMGKDAVFSVKSVGVDGSVVWCFDSRKENIQVSISRIISDTQFGLDIDDAPLQRNGTEDHLQAWLADNVHVFGEGWVLVSREYQTGAGAVDLLLLDSEGNPVAVEVKRIAMLPAVDQVLRYVEALKNLSGFENVRGIIAAYDIRPNTVKAADRRGVDLVTVTK